jgi:hypothetical protein
VGLAGLECRGTALAMAKTTPEGLGQRGMRFWRTAQRGYDFSASELELLTEVCRSLDELEAMASDGAAARDKATARTTLGRLLAQLGLQDANDDTLPSPGTTRARTAARQRWHGAAS